MSRRLRTAALVALPLVLLSVAVAVWAGPYWLERGREYLDRQRWPEQREHVLDAMAAVTLPPRYVEEPCTGEPGPGTRCWHVDARPQDVTAELAAALTAAGAEDVVAENAPLEGPIVLGLARGTVEGREVVLFAAEEVDEEATVAAGGLVMRPGAVVRSTADLDAP